MNRKRRNLGRITALLICVVMLLGTTLTAGAATPDKVQRSYDIAVVFDNSGSMYENTDRWCKAKYAMEIFASMLDYANGDKLTIFPMWEVVTDGSKTNNPEQEKQIDPVEIRSLEDLKKITDMYTTFPDCGTTFKPVEEAHDYLKKSSATEKWIIVMTDGDFYYWGRDGAEPQKKKTASELTERFLKVSGGDINVQYLGFGEATKLQSKPSDKFYTSDTKISLQDNLINICNMIFKRSELPSRYLDGKTLTADISMRKLIVFVQGPNAKVESLTSESGETVPSISDSKQRTYSKLTGNGYELNKNTYYDDSLAGQVVTFDAFKAGKYTLNYSDAKKVQLFYEPDVDMSVILDGPEGLNFDPTQGVIPAGTYNVVAGLKDRETGADITNHPLLGNVDLKVKVKTSDKDEYETFENGAAVTFDPDAGTDIVIEGTYLDDYKISSKDDLNLNWLSGMRVEIPQCDFAVKADCQQKDNWYIIKESATWQPIKVALTINGQPLTPDQLARTEFSATCSSQTLSYRMEKNEAESAYYIYVGQTADGGIIQPETGSYTFSFAGTNYTDDYGEVYTEGKEAVSFDVQTYSKIWVKLIWVIIIGGILLILAAIFFFIMTRKVLPGNVKMDWAELDTLSAGMLDGKMFSEVIYRRKSRALEIRTKGITDPSEICKVSFKIEPVDNRFTNSASRKIRIVDVSSCNCKTFSINGIEYIKNSSGKWVKEISADPDKAKPIAHEISNSTFELKNGSAYITNATLTCRIKRTKK